MNVSIKRLHSGEVLAVIEVPVERQWQAAARDLADDWLYQADLRRRKLRFANLRDGYLVAATLEHADLSFACLVGANLNNTIGLQTGFIRADLSGASLEFARYKRSCFSGASLLYVAGWMADFTDCDFSFARLDHFIGPEVIWRGADFRGASLRSAGMGGDIGGAVFTRADLRGAHLTEVGREQAVWSGALYDSTTVFTGEFSPEAHGLVWIGPRCTLRGLDLAHLDLRHAALEHADLREIRAENADWSGADLQGANLAGANLGWGRLERANLRQANLAGARLRGADLRGADLSEADLTGADLYWANLQDAKLAGVRQDRSTLWPVDFPHGM